MQSRMSEVRLALRVGVPMQLLDRVREQAQSRGLF